MLTTKNLTKNYGELQILKGVNLEVNKGEIVSIVGASGAGKSTLLQIIGTLDHPNSGQVLIDNVDIFSLNAKKMAEFRNQKIGFIFQFHHLLPEFSALENIMMPALINKQSKKEAEKKASFFLDYLQISHRANHKPNEMSGGEQQRVAIARALINEPAIILADEPTGNLDSQNSEAIFQLINNLRKELNQTFVIVTHNDDLALQCDRILKMVDGKIKI